MCILFYYFEGGGQELRNDNFNGAYHLTVTNPHTTPINHIFYCVNNFYSEEQKNTVNQLTQDDTHVSWMLERSAASIVKDLHSNQVQSWNS